MPYDHPHNREEVQVTPPFVQFPLSTEGKEPDFQLESPLSTPTPDSEMQISNIVDEIRGDIPQEAINRFLLDGIKQEFEIAENRLIIGDTFPYETFYNRVKLILGR